MKNKLFSKERNFAILLVLIYFFVMAFVACQLNLNWWGYLLIDLPLIFGIALTRFIYPSFKKFLKSAVDTVLYLPASIAAAYLIVKYRLDLTNQDLYSIFNSTLGAVYIFCLAVAAVMKCCISFSEAVSAYREESIK
ncbi:hypothetical protein [Enterobacter sp. Bisph1]|uniref:hypothetical protein n=1 Tax=Enterobacter sp. Bisph1 TaxID=1274399 RepID=UPI00068EBCEE|nr:hypothetical protein [Enterobacter sp. Bisph1]